jgi:hypothetical protein
MEFSSGKYRKLPSETRTSEAWPRTDDACAVETFISSFRGSAAGRESGIHNHRSGSMDSGLASASLRCPGMTLLTGVGLVVRLDVADKRLGRKDTRARPGSGARSFSPKRNLILKSLPDAQTRPAFDCRGAVGQLVDQSRSQPHVGLQLRLVSQEHAFGPRLEPPRERAHFLDCQWSNLVVCHGASPMACPTRSASGLKTAQSLTQATAEGSRKLASMCRNSGRRLVCPKVDFPRSVHASPSRLSPRGY